MRVHILCCLLLLTLGNLAAQGLEAGFHGGGAILAREPAFGPQEREKRPEFGLWAIFRAVPKVALAVDWAYLPRDSFTVQSGPFFAEEIKRNRQFVDVTFQYHFAGEERMSAFIEAGGGKLWNNRVVVNPEQLPNFGHSGKRTTDHGVWTVGLGFRASLTRRVHWISELKLHNVSDDELRTTRLFTGLTFSIF